MRLAFVVTTTLAVGACQPKSDAIRGEEPSTKPTPSAKPSTPATASASGSATDDPVVVSTTNPPSPKYTKPRKRTSDAGPVWKPATKPIDWAKVKPLNAKEPGGKPIYVAGDDRCFYEVTPKGPPPPLPTGARWVDQVYVDCPAELDDPAWDQCQYSTLLGAPGDPTCYCHSLGGNPPPPPLEVTCPKKK